MGGRRGRLFALNAGVLADASPQVIAFREFSPYPPLRRDLAAVLPLEVDAEQLLAEVRKAGGGVLRQARVFDVFEGEQIGAGRRSLALALTFAADDATLTDDDVKPAEERIVAAIERLGGQLRG